jgi:hypothetical protein
MSETLPVRGAGEATDLVALIADRDRTTHLAMRQQWPIDDALRRKATAVAVALLDHVDYRARTAALRFLVTADSVNARRERTEADERNVDTSSGRAFFARLLATPEGRELAAKLAEAQQPGLPVQTVQTDCQESDSGGVLSRVENDCSSGVSHLPIEREQASTTGDTPTVELPEATPGAQAYTTRPPDAAPPPAPLARPSRAARRRNSGRRG